MSAPQCDQVTDEPPGAYDTARSVQRREAHPSEALAHPINGGPSRPPVGLASGLSQDRPRRRLIMGWASAEGRAAARVN